MSALVEYHRAQQLLANSVLGGWGVYCGFSLCIDADNCTVCVGPGIAVDARGRSIVNDATLCIKRPESGQSGGCDPCAKQPNESLYLAIVYDDCLEGAKPRYGSVCGTGPDPGCDFSRVRERGRLVWIREIDDGYWTSGCLRDPCAPAQDDSGCAPPPAYQDQISSPRLDQCTPCIGIRGGAGVEHYASWLDARWALSKNVALIQDGEEGQRLCQSIVPTLIDIISGAACEPCRGEAVVVLAQVQFSTDDGQPGIRVVPLRRRVLSNASLTYLVERLMQYVLCHRPFHDGPLESEPPPDHAACTDPCLPDRVLVDKVAAAAVGDANADTERLRAAQARAAWYVTYQGKRTLASFKEHDFLDVVFAAHGDTGGQESHQRALERYWNLVQRGGREEAVQRGVALLYPTGVPGHQRAAVEDHVYEFLKANRVAELSTAQAPLVFQLAHKINGEVLGRGELTTPEAERLAKLLPGGVPAPSAEISALRDRVRELEQEMERRAGPASADASAESPRRPPTEAVPESPGKPPAEAAPEGPRKPRRRKDE
jgi:hypothetical protein